MQCKLCLLDYPQLQDSHYLSKGVYRLLRSPGHKNPNPYQVSEEVMFQTSKQVSAHLLCEDCEERFNKCGENWVLKNCLQIDGSFPLRDNINRSAVILSEPDRSTKVFSGALSPKINVNDLAYFATSIFWRGSIHNWNGGKSVPVSLGPYAEFFRKFLMNECSFPDRAYLWVIVRQSSGISSGTHLPYGVKEARFHQYRFAMPGLAFQLMVGNQVPKIARNMCIVHAEGNPVMETDVVENQILEKTKGRILKHHARKQA